MKKLSSLVLGLLIFISFISAVEASNSEAWDKHTKEVVATCAKASNLKNTQVIGNVISFADDVGFDAVLICGNYPQSHMKNAEGQVLCLFNRKTHQVQCTEADQWHIDIVK